MQARLPFTIYHDPKKAPFAAHRSNFVKPLIRGTVKSISIRRDKSRLYKIVHCSLLIVH